MKKNYHYYQQMQIQGLKGKIKPNDIFAFNSYDDLLKINKKKMRNSHIKLLIMEWNFMFKYLERVIDRYKKLYNKTEYWEGKTTYDFNWKDFNNIRKVNGRLTKYYNELKEIYRRSLNEN